LRCEVLDDESIQQLANVLRWNWCAHRLDLTFTNLIDDWFVHLADAVIDRATFGSLCHPHLLTWLPPAVGGLVAEYCTGRRLELCLDYTCLTQKSVPILAALSTYYCD